jgi:hypothetical protein
METNEKIKLTQVGNIEINHYNLANKWQLNITVMRKRLINGKQEGVS